MTANSTISVLGLVDAEFYREARTGKKVTFSAPYSSAVTEEDLNLVHIWQREKEQRKKLVEQASQRREAEAQAIYMILLLMKLLSHTQPSHATVLKGMERKDPEQRWQREREASVLAMDVLEWRFQPTKPNNRVKRYFGQFLRRRKSSTYELGAPVFL